VRDLRYSIRRLVKSPGFTTVVILTLGLGIGANTAIFSVVDTVLLQPLDYRAPDRLVTINHFYRSEALNNLEAPVSAVGFCDYRDKTKSFEAVAVETGWSVNLTGTGDPERIPASRVSGDYFRVFGVAPQLGRVFGRDEDEPGKNQVVVLSDGLLEAHLRRRSRRRRQDDPAQRAELYDPRRHAAGIQGVPQSPS
jgi:putative ABC transport system permease protein